MNAPTTRKRVVYTKSQVLRYLKTKMPEVDWSIISSDLPPLIWRHRWTQLADRLGLPFSKGHLQNEDSRGCGPASYPAA